MLPFSPIASTLASTKRLAETITPPLRLAIAPPGKGMLVAIDAGVEGADALAAGLIEGAKLLMLEPGRDAIAQITEAVQWYRMENLHVVTHGSPGCLHFSSGDFNLSNLPEYAEQVESWFEDRPLRRQSRARVKDPAGFLSLYACNLAKGEAGLLFIEHLQHLTGVSIHAANRRVSSNAAGGSWQLAVSYPFPHQAKFPFVEDLLVG